MLWVSNERRNVTRGNGIDDAGRTAVHLARRPVLPGFETHGGVAQLERSSRAIRRILPSPSPMAEAKWPANARRPIAFIRIGHVTNFCPEDVFDFDQAFERDYPWCAGIGAT